MSRITIEDLPAPEPGDNICGAAGWGGGGPGVGGGLFGIGFFGNGPGSGLKWGGGPLFDGASPSWGGGGPGAGGGG